MALLQNNKFIVSCSRLDCVGNQCCLLVQILYKIWYGLTWNISHLYPFVPICSLLYIKTYWNHMGTKFSISTGHCIVWEFWKKSVQENTKPSTYLQANLQAFGLSRCTHFAFVHERATCCEFEFFDGELAEQRCVPWRVVKPCVFPNVDVAQERDVPLYWEFLDVYFPSQETTIIQSPTNLRYLLTLHVRNGDLQAHQQQTGSWSVSTFFAGPKTRLFSRWNVEFQTSKYWESCFFYSR